MQCLYNISKKKLEMKLIFCMQIIIKSFLQVEFNTLVIKVSVKVILSLLMGMIKHSQIFKGTSFQYLYNISEKKLGMEFIFCMQINIKLALSFLVEMARHIQSTQNMKLVILLQYINPLSVNPTKWSSTQTIRRQFIDEFFQCV